MTTLPSAVQTPGAGFQALEARLQGQLAPERIESLRQAYIVAESAHTGQLRFSGEPFLTHPLQTAIILTDLQIWDPPTLQAALLHDVVEDSAVTLEEIEARFGGEVARLVDGVTKLTRLTDEPVKKGDGAAIPVSQTPAGRQAESLRKMLVAMAQDVRVVFIKLADRLHNMRTLGALPEERRRRIAQETRDIYAPLAHRLGIYQIEWELEDLAFSHLETHEYRRVARLVAERRAEREEQVRQATAQLREELAKVGLKAEVAGRPKSLYSIHNKMQRYEASGRQFGDIHDLLAVRVIVPTVQDCYAALGVVHGLWRPLHGQFDDYIANPRETGYQSLHTTVLALGGKPLEVQIRTAEMHRVSEYGIASHWRYKEGGMADARFEERIAWLRQLLDWQREVTGAEEFIEQVKQDILPDQVFVYTPKGEIRELPAGSTPLDFAFRIHTSLGYRTVGAKVNGRMVSFDYQLKNGDTVEIIASKADKGPSLDWLNPDLGYVRTETAKQRIRQWFRRQERTESAARGRQLLDREARRLGITLEPAKLAHLFGHETEEEFFVALGTGAVSTSQIAARLAPPEEKPVIRVLPSAGELGVEVPGMGVVPARTGRCCRPLPGEEIVGFITRNRGLTVHRRDCTNIEAEDEPERLVDVKWPSYEQKYPATIVVTAQDRMGLLRDITTIVSGEHVNIIDVRDRRNGGKSVTISLTVEIAGLAQVSRLLNRLEGLPGVDSVYRVAGAGQVRRTRPPATMDRKTNT
jgi:GTP pyrophosphokinase